MTAEHRGAPLSAGLVTASRHARVLDPRDVDVIVRIVGWRSEPPIAGIGRSAWVPLQVPVTVDSGGVPVAVGSVKVKGVGLRDHRGEIHQPSTEPYARSISHLGIDQDGTLYEHPASPAPMGGITLARAMVEYATGLALAEHAPMSEIPLFLFSYDGDGRDRGPSRQDGLGVVVAGLPACSPTRGDALLEPRAPTEPLQDMWQQYGKHLRAFHDQGYYRHNANPRNLGLGEQGVYLVDLDSTRHLTECPRAVRPLQMLRDVASGLFHMVTTSIGASVFASPADPGWDDLVSGFLNEYFGTTPPTGRQGLSHCIHEIATELWGTHASPPLVASAAPDAPSPTYQEFMLARDTARSEGIDRPGVFARLLPALGELYEGSSWRDVVRIPVDTVRLTEVAERFLRDRRGAERAT